MHTDNSALYRALKGFTIAIVGGDPREIQLARLQRGFDLDRVVHLPTRRSDPSPRAFGAALRRPDIVLVVWLCGLSRTNHGKQLRAICRTLGIPWVDCLRIPHPHLLDARIDELHLLDAILCRRARVESLQKTGGGL